MLKYIMGIFLIFCIGIFSYLLYIYDQIRFETDKIVYYSPSKATQIVDTKGRLIANLFEDEFRLYANFEEFPPKLIEALISTEDTLFFEHFGINLDAIFRAIIKDIKERRLAEGASTITQQLVKNIVLSRDKKIERKIKEILLALEIERILTKEEILERYLNEVYMGHGYYGFKSASLGYFKKELENLTMKEIAILVSLPRAPSFYDPTKNLKFALSRANKILYRLNSIGWIDDMEYKEAIREIPLIYDQTLTQNVAPYVVDEVLRELNEKIPDIRGGGYTIKTNIDLDFQYIAENALKKGHKEALERAKKEVDLLNGAVVINDTRDGRVLALVGGVDYKSSAFNRATQSKRQPGSSFKPFVYQSALDAGFSPYHRVPDISRTYKYSTEEEDKLWQPKNYTKKFDGLISLRDALSNSINLATINLVEEVGFDRIYKDLSRYGFENLPYNLSITLGSFGISPVELSEKYTLFSNYGEMLKLNIVDNITKDGVTIYKAEYKKSRVILEEQSYLIVDILKNVVNEGTGKRASIDGLQIAGKTGTTNNNVDAWFCGFSPEYQAVVWFGNDDNSPMSRSETGGVASATVFGYIFDEIFKNRPQTIREFEVPKNVTSQKVGGVEILSTKISKPPKQENIREKDRLLF